jgi:Regulator of ribonuclease activity B
MSFLFRRKSRDEIDMEARSPELGIKYKDVSLLELMVEQGADLTQPRHALYFLYFNSADVAHAAADDGRAAGYTCEVRDPVPQRPGQWSVVCERPDALLDPAGVRAADDLFQGIADRHSGEFDGWEAAV